MSNELLTAAASNVALYTAIGTGVRLIPAIIKNYEMQVIANRCCMEVGFNLIGIVGLILSVPSLAKDILQGTPPAEYAPHLIAAAKSSGILLSQAVILGIKRF